MNARELPWPPTYRWALSQARAYLDGTADVQTLHLITSDLFDRYKSEREGQPADELEDALAYIWMRSQRVLREMSTEGEFRSLLLELLPDLERGAEMEAD